MKFEQTYGLQRVRLEANRSFYKYDKFDFLDFDPTIYNALWQWRLSSVLNGTLRFDRQERLTDYSNYLVFSRKNVRTDESRAFDVEWSALGRWHPIASLERLRQRNSEVFRAEDAFTQNTMELGIKYLSPAGNSLSLVSNESRGDYTDRVLDPVNVLDTEFTQNELVAKLSWRLSGKTSIDARWGSLRRRHPHFERRDFSGTTGGVDLAWNVTESMQLAIHATRSLNSFQTSTSSYYVSDGGGMSASWLIGDKTRVRFATSRSRQSYRGESIAASERKDHLSAYELGADWEPTRNVLVKGSIERSQRGSSLAALQYSDRIVKATVYFRF